MRQIAVIGSGGPIPEGVRAMAEELGRAIARAGAVLITGGRGGVMEAACKGAKEAGGLTVGILPGPDGRDANPYVDIAIVTGMGDARNVINVRSADAVIVVHGGAGTLSEVGLALKAGKRVIAIKPSGGVAELVAGLAMGGGNVIPAGSVEEAIELALGGPEGRHGAFGERIGDEDR
ncbi:MAG: TIGR00725 family protein [Candidatus Bathyarchaeia archaeon]